jgi:hypothetical protein
VVKVDALNKPSLNTPNKWLYIVLFFTLATTAWTAFHNVNQEDGENLEVAHQIAIDKIKPLQARSANRSIQAQGAASIQEVGDDTVGVNASWQETKRQPLIKNPQDIFKEHSWVVIPQVKKQKPLPPPPPVAPRTPFIYVGKLEDTANCTQVFLMESNKLHAVTMGEKVNQQWRLDSEDANTLHFTYLPLDLKQVLSKAAKQVIPTTPELNQ